MKWDYIENLDINRKTAVFYVQGKYSVITNKAVTQSIAVTLYRNYILKKPKANLTFKGPMFAYGNANPKDTPIN